MTTATPYTLLLAALVGFRVFHKVYAGKTRENSQGKVADIVLDGIMVVDTVLFYILCLVGVLPQYSTSMEGYAGILTMTFACLTVARIMESRKPKK